MNRACCGGAKNDCRPAPAVVAAVVVVVVEAADSAEVASRSRLQLRDPSQGGYLVMPMTMVVVVAVMTSELRGRYLTNESSCLMSNQKN